MRLIWTHDCDDDGMKTFVSGLYDQEIDTVEHDGIQYGFISFNPITDDKKTVAMREPIGHLDASYKVLVVGIAENTYVSICETQGFDLNDKVKFLEMLEENPSGGIVGKNNPEKNRSIGEIIEDRLGSGTVKYMSLKDFNDNSVSDEPKVSRFYASRTKERTGRYGDEAFVMLEVPAHHKSLDEDVINRYFSSLGPDPTGMKGSNYYLPSNEEKVGVPVRKMNLMSNVCEKTKTPYRKEFRSTSYYNSHSGYKSAGYYNENGEYKSELKNTNRPDKPLNKRGKFLQLAKRIMGEEDWTKRDEDQSFPVGELACKQLRSGAFSKTTMKSQTFGM